MRRIAAILAGTAIVALLGVSAAYVFMAGKTDRFAECRSSKIAGDATIGGPFTLQNSAGQTVTDKDVITGPTLLYFGYTFCPDVCPLDMTRNAEAVDILDERGIPTTPVFISIDPRRDTPKVVGEFAANLHERAIGLTGTEDQVRAASQAYKTYFKAQGDVSDPYYLVDHSTFTYLVLPGYGFVDFFRRDLTPEQVADNVTCFAKAS